METWAIKLRFLWIYENMLKKIAMICSQDTIKHKSMAGYDTDYMVPNLIDFFGDD